MAILDQYRQNCPKYNSLKTENLPYKPLYFSHGSKRFEPDSKYSDLIRTISGFNCLYLGLHFSELAEICQQLLFRSAFSEFKVKIKIS